MPRRRRNSKSAKQQLGVLQSKLIVGGLCAGLLLLVAVAWSLGNSEKLVSVLAVYLTL